MSRDPDDGFLSRWSRLKRERAGAEQRPAPVEEPSPEPAALESAVPAPATLSEEDLAALPRIEDLTEGSDIRPFLRAGVPRDLRNAAMRRMWILTPGIRDYSDPAVDYAWDWNIPGGVPGDGVAPSPERAAKMLRDLFAPKTPVKPKVAEETSRSDGPEGETVPEAHTEGSPPTRAKETAEVPDQRREPSDEQPEEGTLSFEAPARRRHGSALPS